MREDPLLRRSGRIVLRRLVVSDFADFQAVLCDPDVARYQGWESETDDEARQFLADGAAGDLLLPGRWSQIAIALASTGALIGDIGICISADEEQAEIGESLDRGAQGRGLALEAVGAAIRLIFGHKAVRRAISITDVRNRPSILLLRRVAMRRAVERESVVKGETCKEHVFAISRDEAAALER